MPKTHYYAKHNRNNEIFGAIVKARRKPVGNFKEVFYEACCPTVFDLTVTVVLGGIGTLTITGGEYANVDWGDGSSSMHISTAVPQAHKYVAAGTYSVKVSVVDTPEAPVTNAVIAPSAPALFAVEEQPEENPEENPENLEKLTQDDKDPYYETGEEPEQKEPKPKRSNGKGKKDNKDED